MPKEEFKSGFVAIIGKPNVGKSTILNFLLKEKIAIVSPKPETTRDNVQGIITTEKFQIVFVDTPGIHQPHLPLGKQIVKKARSSLSGADLLLVVMEATSGICEEDKRLLDLVRNTEIKSILLINKVDAVKKSRLLPIIEDLSVNYTFLDIIPISALSGDNMDIVKDKVLENLSAGEKYYPDGQVTDKDIKFRISETIREKVLFLTRQEVPHSIAVLIEEMAQRQDKDIMNIRACIYVERDSQKAIIIGKKGSMIKEIGSTARPEIEALVGKKVFLALWVKVLKNWRKDPRALDMLGF
ncbi:MAG: GTPase Era [Candidatus Omnitrophica bacterium]|nr:GTPase Era [Candidatus Omnitrophota bacterium]